VSERSEFGAGLIVCLAKFSEHLRDHRASKVMSIHYYAGLSPTEREREEAEAKRYPVGDAATRLLQISPFRNGTEDLSRALEMWANAASDHFYDLDRTKAPPSLRKLASLTLSMGHGFSGAVWTWEHWEEIHKLWRQACIALDRRLGVKPDWGEW